MKTSIKKWKILFIVAVFPLSFLYYMYAALPFLDQGIDNGSVVYDSIIYMNFAQEHPGLEGLQYLAVLNKNLLGPVIITQLLDDSALKIYAFNMLLLFFSLNALFKAVKINQIYYVTLLLLNPMVFGSLVVINKEILSICAIIFAFTYSQVNKKYYFWISLILSVLSRFEMTFILTVYFCLKMLKSSRSRLYGILLVISVITIVIPRTGGIGLNILEENQSGSSVGLTLFLNQISMNYGFIVSLFPKVMLNLFGDIRFIGSFVYSAISGLFFLLALAIMWRKFSLANDAWLLVLIYSIAFAVPSFVHHRYFLPIYPIFLILAMMSYNKQVKETPQNPHPLPPP